MEFDEYEYLEKTVETNDDSSSKKKTGFSEKSYRKRDDVDVDVDVDVLDEEFPVEDERRRKRSKRDDDVSERRHRDRSKRSRSRERERSKSRRSRSREQERERLKSRRSRSRERERSKSRRSRSRERERERSKSRRSRSQERERERSKSRRSRSRERERERSKLRRSRSRERSKSRRYESDREREIRERELEMKERRRSKEKIEVAEPEADPERDQRTVFAYQMPLKANERDVYEFFSRAGKVRDVRLIMDRNSRRSKGVGYIEFYDVMSVPMAIALSGQLLLGQPVMVKPSEAEKNLVQSNASGGTSTTGQYGGSDRKLYVGNLHFSMTEVQLRQIFEPFGPVELVQLPLDLETGQCKGFGFVQFAQLEHAKAAQSLNGKLEIAGRLIKISSVTDHIGGQDTTVKAADLDDDEGGSLSLNAQSRALLMQKLDRTGFTTSMGGLLGVSGVNGAVTTQSTLPLPLTTQAAVPAKMLPGQLVPAHVTEPVGNPSECLLLKNMFDPSTETEPDFDIDIKEDVEDECSKCGLVKHIYVDKHSAGYVYLRFDSVDAAAKAQQAMHMRWFARRLISALFMQPHEYEAKFKGLN